MPSVDLYTKPGADDEFAEAAQGSRADTAVQPAGLDALTASLIADPASDTRAELDAVYATVVTAISGESATACTARLNAALAAAGAFGTIRHVRLIGDFTINAPLIVQSDTVVDASGATITLAASSNCNMVQNRAVATSQRAVTDAAITTATTTLTSATAAFTSADVGRTVVVNGAGISAGAFALHAIITVVTNSTTVTLDTAATTSVTGATATFYDRDHDITIVGGIWNRGSNGGSGAAQHSFYLRRLDDLHIDIDQFRSTGSGPKYAIHPGDVRRFDLCVRHLEHVSDGIHVRGPATSGIIRNSTGTTTDDFVVLGASDSTRANEGAGNISNVEIFDVRPTSATTGTIKLYGNTGTTITGVHVNGARGTTMGTIWLGASDITGVTLDDITVENVRSNAALPIRIIATSGAIRLANIAGVSTSAAAVSVVNVVTGATVSNLSIRNMTVGNINASSLVYGVNVETGATVTRLTMDNCDFPTVNSTAAGGRLLSVTGTVTDARLSRCNMPSGSSACLTAVEANGTITRLSLDNCTQTGGSGMIKAAFSTCTFGEVWATDCYQTGSAFFADFATATTVHLKGVTNASPTSGSLNLRATANVVLYGSDCDRVAGAVSSTAGYALRVNNASFPFDLSKVTVRSNGDLALNSNAGLSCGAGLVTTNGTTWKNIYTGSTY